MSDFFIIMRLPPELLPVLGLLVVYLRMITSPTLTPSYHSPRTYERDIIPSRISPSYVPKRDSIH